MPHPDLIHFSRKLYRDALRLTSAVTPIKFLYSFTLLIFLYISLRKLMTATQVLQWPEITAKIAAGTVALILLALMVCDEKFTLARILRGGLIVMLISIVTVTCLELTFFAWTDQSSKLP